MIRRPPRSTQSRSSAASDVYKRQGIDVPDDRVPDEREVSLEELCAACHPFQVPGQGIQVSARVVRGLLNGPDRILQVPDIEVEAREPH